jgi:hypothetical protein
VVPVTLAGMPTTDMPTIHKAIVSQTKVRADFFIDQSDATYRLPTKQQWDTLAKLCPVSRRKWQAEVMDCFASTHPVLCRIDGSPKVLTAQQMYRRHSTGVAIEVLDKGAKWQPVISMVEKVSDKPIVALAGNCGLSITTTDHKHLSANGAWDCADELTDPFANNTWVQIKPQGHDAISKDLAWSLGLFCADGHAKETARKTKYINIINCVKKFIDRAALAFNEAFKGTFATPTYASDLAGNVRGNATLRNTQYRLQFSPSGHKKGRSIPGATREYNEYVMSYFNQFYDEDRNKIIPEFILGQPDDVLNEFLDGYYAGNGNKDTTEWSGKVTVPNSVLAAQLYGCYRRLGARSSVAAYKAKRAFDVSFNFRGVEKTSVKSLPSLTHKAGVVYDLTVPSGAFLSSSYLTHNCDDYVNAFRGWLATNGLGNTANGFCSLTMYDSAGNMMGGHAVVLVMDSDRKLWFLEPQNGKLYEPTYAKLGGMFFATSVKIARAFF